MSYKVDLSQVDRILADYKNSKGALIPVLQRIQDHYTYIPQEAVDMIAEAMNISPSEVYGVITFYTQFYTQPEGEYVIKLCRGTACHVKGSKSVLEAIEKKLGIKAGETSKDLKVTLKTVGCLGACALAPVMMINGSYYGKVSPQKIDRILEELGINNIEKNR